METGPEKNKSLRNRANAILERFHESPESVGFHLRLDLSALICELMDQRNMSQRQLAKTAGMQESFVSRIINADSNCTFDVAGRLLFALRLREGDARLIQVPTVGRVQGQSGVVAVVGANNEQRGASGESTLTGTIEATSEVAAPREVGAA